MFWSIPTPHFSISFSSNAMDRQEGFFYITQINIRPAHNKEFNKFAPHSANYLFIIHTLMLIVFDIASSFMMNPKGANLNTVYFIRL